MLCAVAHCLETGKDPEDIISEGAGAQGSLFAEEARVETDPDRADSLGSRIRDHISGRALKRCMLAFLSEEKGREAHILRYLRLGFLLGRDIEARLRDDSVRAVHGMARRTALEAHRMRGFLRFRLLRGGLYYAPMEAGCDVLRLVAPHFLGRMEGQDWMIHDLIRERAALCRGGDLAFVDAPGFEPDISARERRAQELWRGYFSAVAVPERRNPRLQKSLMPERYWRMLIEDPRGPERRDR